MLNDLGLHQNRHIQVTIQILKAMNVTYSALGLSVATRAITMKGPGLLLEFRVAMLTQNISYSFFTLLIWDMLLTLKDEVRRPYLLVQLLLKLHLNLTKVHLIWPARWTVIKWVFLVNRYGIPVLIALGFPCELPCSLATGL